jgi:outer membrane protein assembly factor BamB
VRPYSSLTLVLSYVLFGPVALRAEDWPNFRGPRHDGIVRESGLITATDKPLHLLWEREVGSAFSSFACVGGRVYTCGTQDKQQMLFCLNGETGDVLWQAGLEPEYMERQGGDGTRATPTVHDGLVYVLGALGRLACFDADDGSVVWSHEFHHAPTWGYSGSVLIEGNLAIASGGGSDGALAAFNRKTGDRVWKAGDDSVGYATPYPFTFKDERYVVGFMGESAVIARVDDGRIVWRMPWETSYDVNAASPIFHNGRLLLSSGYNHGAILVKLLSAAGDLKSSKIWQERALRNKFQSPILYEGHVYTCDEKSLKCVNFLTGKTKWEQRRIDGAGLQHGTIVLVEPSAGSGQPSEAATEAGASEPGSRGSQPAHLYVLTQDGQLLVAPATTNGFEPVLRAEILSGRCWVVPVISGGRLYARNMTRVVCFDLRE